MATVIPFPLTKLAAGEARPLALMDTQSRHIGSAVILELSDYRPTPAQRARDWIEAGPFNANLCME